MPATYLVITVFLIGLIVGIMLGIHFTYESMDKELLRKMERENKANKDFTQSGLW